MSDSEYDALAKDLMEQYLTLPHWFTSLIDKDSLQAGTAYSLRLENLPSYAKRVWYLWNLYNDQDTLKKITIYKDSLSKFKKRKKNDKQSV